MKASKQCSRCLVDKEMGEYNRKAESRDGRAAACRECTDKGAERATYTPMTKEQMGKVIYLEQPLHKDVIAVIVNYCRYYPTRSVGEVAQWTGYSVYDVYRAQKANRLASA